MPTSFCDRAIDRLKLLTTSILEPFIFQDVTSFKNIEYLVLYDKSQRAWGAEPPKVSNYP
jgi:hypothetical protein